MVKKVRKLEERVKAIIEKSLHGYEGKRGKLINAIRMGHFALENYKKTRSDLWSSSLTYFTLLSIVPLLAIAFSIAKGFGADKLISEEILRNSPLQPEALDKLLIFAENMMTNAKGGIIAGAGLIFLSWSIVKIFTLIEKSFNEIWKIKKGRTFIRKFTDYFAIIILYPIVVLLSNGLVDAVQSELIKEGSFLNIVIDITPQLILAMFFTMIYKIIPNTVVKFKNALIAGIFTTVLFTGMQTLVVQSQMFLLSYNKVYGSFSVVPIFIVWQKMVWFIILLGGHLSFVLQNSYKFGHTIDEFNMSMKSKREALAMLVYLMIENYELEAEALTIEQIGMKLSVSLGETNQLLNEAMEMGMIVEVLNEKEERGFKLVKNINTFSLDEFIKEIEGYGYHIIMGNEETYEKVKTFNEQYKSKDWNILMKEFNEGGNE